MLVQCCLVFAGVFPRLSLKISTEKDPKMQRLAADDIFLGSN